MSSRVIVKGLPKHTTEDRLKELFGIAGEITDCQLKKTKDGIFRNFAFLGFRREEEAQKAVKVLNRSFFDTSRIFVEIAQAPGSDALPRPWSRYTPGSTKYAKEQAQVDNDQEGETAVNPAVNSNTKGKKSKTAAKKNGEEVPKDPHANSTDDDADALPSAAAAATVAATAALAASTAEDDDAGDDLNWLLKKRSAAPAEEKQAGVEVDLETSGRLYVTNLPYAASEEELREHFESMGEVDVVTICKDEDNLKSRGFGYVSYVFPENAIRAQAELDMKPFQGRVIRLTAATEKPEKKDIDNEAVSLKGRTSSYKRNLELRKKKVDAHLPQTWNLLYVSANAAADVAAAQLNVSKGDLFGKDSEDAALTAALTETSIIQQTKRWLQKEGIRVEAFEQTGASLDKSKALQTPGGQRRDDTFIVKHLPAGSDAQELRERFARGGEMVRCSLAPSGTVAVVQYVDKGNAQRAFKKLAFSRYKHVPLYLEWAPEDVFVTDGGAPSGSQESQGGAVSSTAPVDNKDLLPDNEDEDESKRGYLFVKNLNFESSDAALKAAFNGSKGFRAAVIMRKKTVTADATDDAAARGGKSMGYGFIEFDTPGNATEALKRRQGVVVDGYALQLQLSQRGRSVVGKGGGEATKGKGKPSGPLSSPRLCVRNLAFEVTRKELQKLFGHYGSVTAVRIPKKGDYSGHRGFGFIDFASQSEAAAAYEALQHTHLYGRRLVIEPAEENATDVASIQETAERKRTAKAMKSEATASKRRRKGMLDGPGEGKFKDAMM